MGWSNQTWAIAGQARSKSFTSGRFACTVAAYDSKPGTGSHPGCIANPNWYYFANKYVSSDSDCNLARRRSGSAPEYQWPESRRQVLSCFQSWCRLLVLAVLDIGADHLGRTCAQHVLLAFVATFALRLPFDKAPPHVLLASAASSACQGHHRGVQHILPTLAAASSTTRDGVYFRQVATPVVIT